MTSLSEQVITRLIPEQSPDTLDPVGWIERVLGMQLWSVQRQIVETVRDNRHTAVRSAHGIGKSAVSAALTAWWCSTRPVGDAFAVTTAPTSPQLEAILWREIGRAHRRGNLQGRITAGPVPRWTIGNELVAYGRKPQDLTDPEQAAAAFQGIHARHVLVIADEAAGIPPWLWDAIDTLTTTESARVLAIGNPTDPQSRFAEVSQPGSGWATIQVSAFDTPAFTGEKVRSELLDLLVSERWVEERRKRWGEDSPLYTARVLGEFPAQSEDMLISPAAVRAAQERELVPDGPPRLGVDVARAGNDETVAYSNRSGVIRREFAARGEETMQTAGRFARLLRAHEESRAAIDIIGIGAGVYDRLQEQGLGVEPFQASEKASQPKRFANRRAESYWQLREAFAAGEVDLDPEDEELASQLLSIRWSINSSGRILIESKDVMRKRGMPSPDRADAVAMAFPRAVKTRLMPSHKRSIYDLVLGPPKDELTRTGAFDGRRAQDLQTMDW